MPMSIQYAGFHVQPYGRSRTRGLRIIPSTLS
jgi:hypothetical protein